MSEPKLSEYQRSFACCEVHTPDLWEGDGTCVICEAVHLDDRAKAAEAALSAICALVQQWRERVAVCRRISAESAARGELVLGRAWAEEADHKQESITELTALCPAPPEDQT